jgi:hypothetical protein
VPARTYLIFGDIEGSLGADVVRVMTKPGIAIPPAEFNRPISNEILATLYDRRADAMWEWLADLYHVAMRIRAHEEGTADPGALIEDQAKRQQEKAEKGKSKKKAKKEKQLNSPAQKRS